MKLAYPPQNIISKSGTEIIVKSDEVIAVPIPNNFLVSKYVDNIRSTFTVPINILSKKAAAIASVGPAKIWTVANIV